MDFRAEVIAALDRVIEGGVIQSTIEKTIVKTVESAIESELRAYSAFGERLKEAIAESLKFNGDDLAIPGYNDLILKIVRQSVEGKVNAAIQKQVAEQLEELLQSPPESIKFSELVEEFKEWAAGQGHCRCDGEGRVAIIVDESDSVATDKGKYRHVFLDPDGEESSYLGGTKAKGKFSYAVQLDVTPDGRVYGIKFRGEDINKTLFVGHLYGFERRVFQMKAAGTKIVFDVEVEDLDLSLSASGS